MRDTILKVFKVAWQASRRARMKGFYRIEFTFAVWMKWQRNGHNLSEALNACLSERVWRRLG